MANTTAQPARPARRRFKLVLSLPSVEGDPAATRRLRAILKSIGRRFGGKVVGVVRDESGGNPPGWEEATNLGE